MSQLARAYSSKTRTLVITTSAIFLTLQVISLVGSVVFYLFASSTQYRDLVAQNVLTVLYSRHEWQWMRREQVLEVIILSSSVPFTVHTCDTRRVSYYIKVWNFRAQFNIIW